MMARDEKSAVILGLRKHHGLLAAFLEAADKIDHKRMVIGEMPKLVNVKTRQASTAPQLPQVGPSVGSAFPGRLIRWLEHFRCRYFHRWRDVRLESAHRSQADVDYPQAAHRAVSCASDSCGLHFNSPLGTPHTRHGSMARTYHAATAEDEG